ncbi:hypothetical protein PISMIDRAFT_680133 [Pisolithus microcarpus 441]|uniref:Uncharacterized protein n=1 Tax=Pisolithus microcarpus 441 TaxID=765257 RepID=A0A0C9YCP3_9AGAM|nr:hypothetical protein PISMIDRAFT_680133 [Pisolithus microcarpus 441]
MSDVGGVLAARSLIYTQSSHLRKVVSDSSVAPSFIGHRVSGYSIPLLDHRPAYIARVVYRRHG